MPAYLMQRIAQSVLVLLLVSILVFCGVYAIGDPVELLASPDATTAELDAIRVGMGLDQPIWIQYRKFLMGLMSGDLGTSFVYNQPTVSLILHRLPATMELGLVAFVMSLVVGLPLGLIAGYFSERPIDNTIMTGSIFAFSLPSFWQGLLLIIVFAVSLGWMPAGDRGETASILGLSSSLFTWDGWHHIILPATNLALFNAALIIRLTRASVQEAMNSDYVRFARARGISERKILLRHAFKNIRIPLVTILGLELGNLLAYGIITETVFDWPGMGQLLIDSIRLADRPVVVGYILIVVTMFILINTVVDILYTFLDPRIRLSGA